MHTKTLVKRLLRIDGIAIESVYFEVVYDEEKLIIKARPYARDRNLCPHCGKRCPGYDSANKLRRWRSLDLGSTMVFIEGFAPRIKCPEHGVIVAKVPWAGHGSNYTYNFEMAVAWLALHATSRDVAEYFRIKWDTVSPITQRVQESLDKNQTNRFDNLVEIGIDETSYKKGHKYMTVVINHETGHLVWARKGYGKEVLTEFFKELSEEQRANILFVTADGARWISDCVAEYCPNAKRCVDPFHVVTWANDSLDEVRRATIRQAKKDVSEGKAGEASAKKRGTKTSDLPP